MEDMEQQRQFQELLDRIRSIEDKVNYLTERELQRERSQKKHQEEAANPKVLYLP